LLALRCQDASIVPSLAPCLPQNHLPLLSVLTSVLRGPDARSWILSTTMPAAFSCLAELNSASYGACRTLLGNSVHELFHRSKSSFFLLLAFCRYSSRDILVSVFLLKTFGVHYSSPDFSSLGFASGRLRPNTTSRY